MKSVMRRVPRVPLLRTAVAFFLAAAACGPTAGGGEKDAVKNAVPVEEVREQVRQFALGGGEKDAAGEKFYEWGVAAHPALAQLVRDPTVTQEELDTIMFIVATQAHTPELFAALRTRFEAIPAGEERTMRLGLLRQYEAMPGISKP